MNKSAAVGSKIMEVLGKTVSHYIIRWLTAPRTVERVGGLVLPNMGHRGESQEGLLVGANRVLVVRLDEIGDVVMTTSFLRELRRNLSGAWITLVVKPGVYNLVELCPYVDEVLTYDWNVPSKLVQLRRHGRALHLAWTHLWRRRFDLAIVPRWDVDYYHGSFVAYFSGARWRLGFSENVIEDKCWINKDYDVLFTHVLDDRTVRHEVERNLAVLGFLGGQIKDQKVELWLGSDDDGFAEQWLAAHASCSDDIRIAFGPGAGDPKRMWPLGNYAEMGAWLQGEYGASIVVVGGPGEEELGRGLRQSLGGRVIDAVGQATLRQTTALLRRCHLYVGSDSGPMHLAAAVGVPVVEISCYPSTGTPAHANSPVRFGPWGVPSVVLQPAVAVAPCTDGCSAAEPHCILGITVDQVKIAIRGLLAQRQYTPEYAD